MKLKVKQRSHATKAEIKRIRHEKNVPAILYGKGEKSESLEVDGEMFSTCMREMETGHLPTTVFELDLDGAIRKAIVKDIHYNRTTYQVQHVDFFLLNEKENVEVNVPVHFDGVAECVGIKLGGFLRQVKRHVKVRCLPKDLPSNFNLNIRSLGLKQNKRVEDIVFASGVTPLSGPKDVVVTIAK